MVIKQALQPFSVPNKSTWGFLKGIGASQIIFVGMDAVLGSVHLPAITTRFGEVDNIHCLREGREGWNDADLLRECGHVVCTAWSLERTQDALAVLERENPGSAEKVRIYELGQRLGV